MIKIEVGESTSVQVNGRSFLLVNEALNAVVALNHVLRGCEGGELMSALFRDALRSDEYWAIGPKEIKEDSHGKRRD